METPIAKLPSLTVGMMTVLLLMAFSSTARAADDWQDHELIRAAAVQAIRAQLASRNSRLEVKADRLDARLHLVRCESPLAVTVPQGRRSTSRVTAEVRCVGPNAWKIHVPARLVVYQNVVVAARSLQRGSVLTESDILMAETDTSSLPYGYLARPDHAIGHELRRSVMAGKPVTPSVLVAATIVKRGQQVTLEARSGGMAVRMAGVAREDGIKGQVIEVENRNSKRVVHAIVRSGRTVEVLLH